MGAIAGDGGMGTTLTDVGEILAGSATLDFPDPTTTDFFAEASDSPIYTKVVQGIKTLKFSLVDVTNTNAAIFLGGTASGTTPNCKWASPTAFPAIEKSLQIVTADSVTISICRGKVFASVVWGLDKTKIAQINVTVKILKPTKAGVEDISWLHA